MEQAGVWLPILEYARYRDISISTIRRMIKTDRVKSRLEDGKYFIFVAKERLDKKKHEQEVLSQRLEELTLENEHLKRLLKKREEELSELKMLLNVYEEREIPPLPFEFNQYEN